MRRSYRLSLSIVAATALLHGCADPQALSNEEEGPGEVVASARLELYGVGQKQQSLFYPACAAARYRQFDFWLGTWDVYSPEGSLDGTNTVRSDLDGCLVEESWVDVGGVRGRSFSSYDAAQGAWFQTWVTESLAHTRVQGGLDTEGRMDMSGTRVSATTGAMIYDHWTWTDLGAGQVQQVGILDVPARGIHSEYVGLYNRVPAVTPLPATGVTSCNPGGRGAANRGFDFATGQWKLTTEHGLGLGQSDLHTDLSGCVFEENAAGLFGYRSRSFIYFDAVEQRWYQTLVDNKGGRLELRGTLSDGVLVLSGTKPGPGGTSLGVRVTWTAPGTNQLRQQWEVSLDGGTTWLGDLVVMYTRQ